MHGIHTIVPKNTRFFKLQKSKIIFLIVQGTLMNINSGDRRLFKIPKMIKKSHMLMVQIKQIISSSGMISTKIFKLFIVNSILYLLAECCGGKKISKQKLM